MKKLWKDPFVPSSLRGQVRLETIVGTLRAIQWSPNGVATKFSICSFDDGELIVEYYDDIRKLQRLEGKIVEARGCIYFNDEGDKIIEPKNVRELKGSNPSQVYSEINIEDLNWVDELPTWVPEKLPGMHFVAGASRCY